MDKIRQLLDQVGRLPVKAESLAGNQDLYAAGLTPFAAVQIMQALEERFGVVFPEDKLNRATFATLDSIERALGQARPVKSAA
ncbi:MAG: acyl carrier protein [Hyphomicrobiales bacterium]|nr:acyl carrier protein [Hyphomicrobiales bacterium]